MAHGLKRHIGRLFCLMACSLLPGWHNAVEAQFRPGLQHVYPLYYPEEERFNLLPISYNVALRGQNHIEMVYNFGRDWLDLDRNGAATLAGAAMLASDADPTYNAGGGCGLMAWSCGGERYRMSVEFASSHNFNLNDLRTQLFFLGFELNDFFVPENSGLEGGYLPDAWRLLGEQHGAADDEKALLVALIENLDGPENVPDDIHDEIDDIYTAYNNNEVIKQDHLPITNLFLSIPLDGNCDRFGQGGSNPDALGSSLMTTVPIYGLRTPSGNQAAVSLNPCLADRAEALFRDLNRTMEQLGESKLGAGGAVGWGGYRSHQRQKELRIKHCKIHNSGLTTQQIYYTSGLTCKPPTAPAGRSRHEAGLAIDFTVAVDNTVRGSDPALYSTGRGRAAFLWLQQNASNYGLENFEKENWHWSIDGH